MNYNSILITGGNGKLGKALIKSISPKESILSPTRADLDITDSTSVSKYFETHKIDAVIHCAAIASVRICEKNSDLAVATNVIGTANILRESMNVPNLRLIYISTDYVYPCTKGPYKETDYVEPFTVYAWTKLAGENLVRLHLNHCIIRTSFFQPENISFETAFKDSFCSKIPITELAEEIIKLLNGKFIGIVNVGQNRISLYDLYKKYKPEIKPELMPTEGLVKRANDSSLDISLWRKIKKTLNSDSSFLDVQSGLKHFDIR